MVVLSESFRRCAITEIAYSVNQPFDMAPPVRGRRITVFIFDLTPRRAFLFLYNFAVPAVREFWILHPLILASDRLEFFPG